MSGDLRRGRAWLALGALNGFLAVALGAFAAHGLADRLDPHLLSVFQKGVDYQGFHALALLGVGLLAVLRPGASWLRAAGILFVGGILLFSGSLYLLALTGVRGWGMVTPVGGTAFLLGWACLGVGVWKVPPAVAAAGG